MGYLAVAWGVVLAMFVWAAYLYFHWSGVEALPMQWGLTGKPTWYATRGAALLCLPVIAAFVLGMMTFARRGHSPSPGIIMVSAMLLMIQALWVFLARR